MRFLSSPKSRLVHQTTLAIRFCSGFFSVNKEFELLRGVPADAWRYGLDSRSALEWVLDQYKEKKPRDPTIRERFNTYRFADYKEDVNELLRRVYTVSVRTMEVVDGMGDVSRSRKESSVEIS